MNHPNIATVHGLHAREPVEGEPALRFLTMELVPGEDLESRFSRGPLPPAKTLEICRQIALAIEAAHTNGIVHRDLKPANIILTPDGQGEEIGGLCSERPPSSNRNTVIDSYSRSRRIKRSSRRPPAGTFPSRAIDLM